MSLDSDQMKALAYLGIGAALLTFMALHDVIKGRPVQKRDLHILVFWPLVAVFVFVIGLVEFSDLTSRNGDEPK